MFLSGRVALRTARVEADDTPAYTASIIGEGQTRKQIGRLSAWRAWSNVGGTVFSILSLDEGGIKGAFSASVLATLEEDTGRKVRQNAISVRPCRRAICASARCQRLKAS